MVDKDIVIDDKSMDKYVYVLTGVSRPLSTASNSASRKVVPS